MAFIEKKTVKAQNKAGGKGEITIEHLLTPNELDGKCLMFAKVTPHKGNTETYHILQGKALYNDNGEEVQIDAGTTTFCPDGEVHGIENIGDDDLIFIALIISK